MEWYVGYLYHVKPMLICHLIATMRGSYNTGAAANLNMMGLPGDGNDSAVPYLVGVGLGL